LAHSVAARSFAGQINVESYAYTLGFSDKPRDLIMSFVHAAKVDGSISKQPRMLWLCNDDVSLWLSIILPITV